MNNTPTKKYYTIKITGTSCAPKIWYHDKVGRQYRAELKSCQGVVVFMVNPCQWIYQADCKIMKEQIVPIYFPKRKNLNHDNDTYS
jgi:hypothetical protein